MLRLIGGIVAGIVVWVAVATVLDFGLRYGWHDYAAVEKAMNFTLAMMVARLSESALSSLIAGYLAAVIGRSAFSPLLAGTFLLLLFAPEHYALWHKFPIWYHLTFLISLPVLSVVGGSLSFARESAA